MKNKTMKASQLKVPMPKVQSELNKSNERIVEGDMNAVHQWLYHLPAERYLKIVGGNK